MCDDVRLFLRYIGSSIVGMVIAGSFTIVDTIFLGQYAGKISLAAVALTLPLVMIFGAVGDMLGAGAAVLIAQAHGGGNKTKAPKIFGNMVTLQVISALILGGLVWVWLKPLLLLFGATQDLLPDAMLYSKIMIIGALVSMLMMGFVEVVRNDGRPYLSMMLVVFGLLGNMFLDWLFIVVFRWGVAGAAYATVISQGVSVVIGGIYFLTPKTLLKFTLENLKLNYAVTQEIVLAGIPIFGNMFSVIAMLFMHNFQALRYGHVDGLAAYTLVAGLESFGSMVMEGLAAGVQPITAYMHGAGEHKRKNRIGNYGYWTAFILGIVFMLFSFALRNVMPGWVGLTGAVAEMAAHGVLLSSTAFILLGVVRVAGFYYQSTGKIGKSSILVYGDAFFALPLCLFTLPIWFGMNGIWLAMPISRVILFAILCYLWFGKRTERIVIHA